MLPRSRCICASRSAWRNESTLTLVSPAGIFLDGGASKIRRRSADSMLLPRHFVNISVPSLTACELAGESSQHSSSCIKRLQTHSPRFVPAGTAVSLFEPLHQKPARVQTVAASTSSVGFPVLHGLTAH